MLLHGRLSLIHFCYLLKDNIEYNGRNNPPKAFKQEPRLVAGVFVYRHLGLLGCNIAIIKRSLTLLLIGSAFSAYAQYQDESNKIY